MSAYDIHVYTAKTQRNKTQKSSQIENRTYRVEPIITYAHVTCTTSSRLTMVASFLKFDAHTIKYVAGLCRSKN